ncbi:ankyrin repeat-containing domain protein [Xylaria palmicola]|nr:ankyrin repeat-containing domain protein [Xylaria palmicola]
MDEFFNAIRADDLPRVRDLVHEGVNVDAIGGDGQPALCVAARTKNFEMVKLLVDKGANVNNVGTHDWTPLCGAVYGGHFEIVEFLVRNGASTNDTAGCPAIFHAARAGMIEITKLLLDHGANANAIYDDELLLHDAIFSTGPARLEIIKILVDNGADFNQPGMGYGCALHAAAAIAARRQTGPEVVKFLIDKGADVNFQDKFQQTALHHTQQPDTDIYAPSKPSSPIIQLLLENGASPNAGDDIGTTPFDLAVRFRNSEIVRLMLPKMDRPPSLPAEEWRAILYPGSRKIRFQFEEFLSIIKLRSSDYSRLMKLYDLIRLENGGLDWFAYGDHLIEPRKYIHDVVDGHTLWEFNHFEFTCQWWRKREGDAETILTGYSWRRQPSLLPSPDLCRRLHHNDVLIVSWFVVPCPTITQGRWPVPLGTIAQEPHDIKQFEGFFWVTALQPPDGSARDAPTEILWRLLFSLTTVDHVPVKRIHNIGDLVNPLIDKLGRTFMENNLQASRKLSRSRLDVLRNGGDNPQLIQDLLSDATVIENIAESHAEIVRSLKNLFGSVERMQKGPWRLDEDALEESKRMMKQLEVQGEELCMLLEKSQSIIQLEFNLVSILEAQRSTTTNRSLKRLTWVTFAYLPLLFVASLFGMNVDILSQNPSWWWYFPVAGGFSFLTFAVWIIFKRFHALEGKLENSFTWLVGDGPKAKSE